MTMFKDLARHSYLGSIAEFRYLFENIFTSKKPVGYFDIEHKCKRKPFLFRDGVLPILDLLTAIGLIESDSDGKAYFSLLGILKEDHSDLPFVTVKNLLDKLSLCNEFDSLFDDKTIEFDSVNGKYFIRSYHIRPYLNNIKRLLIDIGFFHVGKTLKTILIIDTEFTPLFESYLPTKLKQILPLNKLKELNELNDKLGKEAELYVLEKEKSRLNGHKLFHRIIRISEQNSAAGYDIESLETHESMAIDRFIEVKSFSNNVRFYWSASEVNAAKEFKTRYFLCLVDREKMNDANYKPTYIGNPYKEIFSGDEAWDKKVEKWLINKNKTGK
jgi:Domain of unknown function (DUF3883)